jgi:hypothetical protein
MDELIRKQTVLNMIDDVQFGNITHKLSQLHEAVRNLPSVDAVEVVRCKDCKYFDGECCDRYADETLGYSHSTQPNFFCACGERKTDV